MFLLFIPKEALNIHVDNVKVNETSLPPPPPPLDRSDHHEAEGMKTCTDFKIFFGGGVCVKSCSLQLRKQFGVSFIYRKA